MVDRMVQQAIAQVLTPIYEPQFSETSYGFRPNRSAHDALRKCQEYANDGYRYVVDMDFTYSRENAGSSFTKSLSGR